MRLKVLGSSSAGNCYILESDAEALIIEAGLPFKEVKIALDFNISKIVGLICTHRHKDHSGFVAEYERAGIPVFKPYDGMKDMDLQGGAGFIIQAFPNRDKDGKWLHGYGDGTECPCYGFYVQHPDIGSLVYATDAEYIRWRFKGINHILVEANYSKDLVSDIPEKRRHVLTGHMEIGTTCEFLKANNNSGLRNVILLHLSGDSADAGNFMVKAKKVVDCPVYVARKGLEVDLRLVPF